MKSQPRERVELLKADMAGMYITHAYTGVGVGTFNTYAQRYIDDSSRLNPKARNQPLVLRAEGGSPLLASVLLCCLALLLIMLLNIAKIRENDFYKFVGLGILAVLIYVYRGEHIVSIGFVLVFLAVAAIMVGFLYERKARPEPNRLRFAFELTVWLVLLVVGLGWMIAQWQFTVKMKSAGREMENGNFVRAVESCRAAVDWNPLSAEAFYQWADALWKSGGNNGNVEDQAVIQDLLVDSVSLNPWDHRVYKLKSDVLWELKRYSESLRALETAHKHNPYGHLKEKDYSELLSERYEFAGELKNAAGMYRELLAAEKGAPSIELLFKLGRLYEKMGKRDRALRQYNEILRLDRDHAGARAEADRLKGRN